MKHSKEWKDVLWAEFCDWVSGRHVAETTTGYDGTIHLVFKDGSEATVQSNYEGPFSSVTPGEGIQPPTVRVKD